MATLKNLLEQSGGNKSITYPEDLWTNGKYICHIKVLKHSAAVVGPAETQEGRTREGLANIFLPLPGDLKERQDHEYVEKNLLLDSFSSGSFGSSVSRVLPSGTPPAVRGVVASAGNFLGRRVGGAISSATDTALNPVMFLTYKRPKFREYQFEWTFAPRSLQDSQNLDNAIRWLKFFTIPQSLGGLLLRYPQEIWVNFNKIESQGRVKDLIKPLFKPAFVKELSVQYYDQDGQVMFFTDTVYPAYIKLSLFFIENEYFVKNNVEDLKAQMTQNDYTEENIDYQDITSTQ